MKGMILFERKREKSKYLWIIFFEFSIDTCHNTTLLKLNFYMGIDFYINKYTIVEYLIIKNLCIFIFYVLYLY